MSDRPSLETRLARRAERDYSAGGSFLRRAARNAGSGRMLARMEARRASRTAQLSRMAQRSWAGDFLLNRLAARTGEGRALRAPVGSASVADAYAYATPPWLARQEAAEETITQVRRTLSRPTPSIPAANVIPVAASAPLARAHRLARSSGIAPPTLSTAALRASGPASAPDALPQNWGPSAGPGLSRAFSAPLSGQSFSSSRPAPAASAPVARSAVAGPLSRTASAVWSTPTHAPAQRSALRPGGRALARLEAAGAGPAALGPRGPLRTAPVLSRSEATRPLGRGFGISRAVGAGLRRSAQSYPELSHLIAPSLEAPVEAAEAAPAAVEPWVRVSRSAAPAPAAPAAAPYVAPRSTAPIARSGAGPVASSAVTARQIARQAARTAAAPAAAARGLARFAAAPAPAAEAVAAATDRGTLRRSSSSRPWSGAPTASALSAPSASSAPVASSAPSAFVGAPIARSRSVDAPLARVAARGLGLRGPDAVQRAVAPHAARRRSVTGSTAALALAAPAPSGFAAPAGSVEAPESTPIYRSTRPLTAPRGPAASSAPLARSTERAARPLTAAAARTAAPASTALVARSGSRPTAASAPSATSSAAPWTGAPTAVARSSRPPTATARAMASGPSASVAGGSIARAARREAAVPRWTDPTSGVSRSLARALPTSAAAFRAAPQSAAGIARSFGRPGSGPDLALPSFPGYAAAPAVEAPVEEAPAAWVRRSAAPTPTPAPPSAPYVPPASTAPIARSAGPAPTSSALVARSGDTRAQSTAVTASPVSRAVSRSVSPASRAFARMGELPAPTGPQPSLARAASPATRVLSRFAAPASSALLAGPGAPATASSAPTARLLQRAASSAQRATPAGVARSLTSSSGLGPARSVRRSGLSAPDTLLAAPTAARSEAPAPAPEAAPSPWLRRSAAEPAPSTGWIAPAAPYVGAPTASPSARALSRSALAGPEITSTAYVGAPTASSQPRAARSASPAEKALSRAGLPLATPSSIGPGTPDRSGVVSRSSRRLAARTPQQARPLTGRIAPSLDLPAATFGIPASLATPDPTPAVQRSASPWITPPAASAPTASGPRGGAASSAVLARAARRAPASTAVTARPGGSAPSGSAPLARSSAAAGSTALSAGPGSGPTASSALLARSGGAAPRSTSAVARAAARAAADTTLPLGRGAGFRRSADPGSMALPIGFGPVGAFDAPEAAVAAPQAGPAASPWVVSRSAQAPTSSASTAAWSTRGGPGATTADPAYRAHSGAPTASRRASGGPRAARTATGLTVARAPSSTAVTAPGAVSRSARPADGPRGLARVIARSDELARETDQGAQLTYAGAPLAAARSEAPQSTATIVSGPRGAMRRADAGTRAYRRPGMSRATLARIARAQGSEGIGSVAGTDTLADAGGMVQRAADKSIERRAAAPVRRSTVHRAPRNEAARLAEPNIRAMVRREIEDLTTISAKAPIFSAEHIAREAKKQLARQETPVTSGGGKKKGSDESKADLDDFLLRVVRQIMRDEGVWGERIFNPFD